MCVECVVSLIVSPSVDCCLTASATAFFDREWFLQALLQARRWGHNERAPRDVVTWYQKSYSFGLLLRCCWSHSKRGGSKKRNLKNQMRGIGFWHTADSVNIDSSLAAAAATPSPSDRPLVLAPHQWLVRVRVHSRNSKTWK